MKTVLLVDDEPNLRFLVRLTLEPDCRVLEAADGTSALEVVRHECPDLILLDWMMPGMSGIELMRELRGERATEHTPVIMLTARGQARDREEALAVGCTCILVKPFSPLELLRCVHQVLDGGLDTRALTDDPIGATSSGATLTELSSMQPQLALYVRDLKQAVEIADTHARHLAAANARLAILSRLKTDFLQFVSHELKTPLYAMSAVQLLDARRANADQAELIESMRQGYGRLRHFIEKGLEYFDWVGREEARCDGRVDLFDVARKASAEIAGRQADPARLRVLGLRGAAAVRGQATGLATVVRILVENAFKFSTAGIDVELSTDGEHVAVRVADHGVGLSAAMLLEVFHPFTSADIERHAEGTGLNLALARVIVEAHGGSIRAESAGPGCGATFIVELALARAQEAVGAGAASTESA